MSIPSIVTGMLLVTDKLLNPGLVGGLARVLEVEATGITMGTSGLIGAGTTVATGKTLVASIGMVMLGAGVTTGEAPMLGAAILIY